MGTKVKPSPLTPSPNRGERTKRSRRVLFIDHADFLGGAERSGLELMRSIDAEKFSISLACAPGALMDAARAQGLRVLPLKLPQVRGLRNLWSAPFKWIAGVLALLRLIRRERIEIVHSNTMRATVYAALAARLSGVKFVWHVRDLHREHAYLWLMSKLANAIIANSRAVAQTLPPFAQHKTTVVYNGLSLRDFDPSRFDGSQLRSEFGLSDEHHLIGNIGWLAPWKGHREFIEVASRIAVQCPQARFIIVGAVSDERYRAYAEELRTLAAQRLSEKLIWAGARQPIQPVLAALDLLLHCADQEPFGRVLIEAMALQVPVMAFAGGGPDEIIEHNQTGVLVGSHDIMSMAEAALRWLADPATRQAMGIAARQRVMALFDSDANARQVEQIYASLLKR